MIRHLTRVVQPAVTMTPLTSFIALVQVQHRLQHRVQLHLRRNMNARVGAGLGIPSQTCASQVVRLDRVQILVSRSCSVNQVREVPVVLDQPPTIVYILLAVVSPVGQIQEEIVAVPMLALRS